MVELILAQPPTIDRLWLIQYLRRDCGNSLCGFRATNPEGTSPLSAAEITQATRKAADRMTGCLIVEPLDDPEVRKALTEAGSKGLPIVLLDTPLPSSPPAKPFPCVKFTGFTEAGKAIVQILKEDAAQLKLPASGTALVIENRQKNVFSRPRLESLTGALKAAGLAYQVVTFEGEAKEAAEVVTKHLESHPGVTMILSDDDFGLEGVHKVRTERKKQGKPEVVAGGFGALDERANSMVKQGTEVMAECSTVSYARKALQVALDLMNGKPAPERVEVEMPLLRKGVASGPSPERPKKQP